MLWQDADGDDHKNRRDRWTHMNEPGGPARRRGGMSHYELLRRMERLFLVIDEQADTFLLVG